MTLILRILAWLWPARERDPQRKKYLPYDYYPTCEELSGHPWPPRKGDSNG